MNASKIKEKLYNQSITDDKWLSEAKERQQNEGWLNLSAAIALRILDYLKAHKITQKELSEQLGYSPQYMNKIVKGSENLTLDSIVKIEKVLGFPLIKVISDDNIEENLTVSHLLEESVF